MKCGLQSYVLGVQAIHNASSDADKAKYTQQFQQMWKQREPRSQKWDKAFAVLHKELETMHTHLQAFHDQHAPPSTVSAA